MDPQTATDTAGALSAWLAGQKLAGYTVTAREDADGNLTVLAEKLDGFTCQFSDPAQLVWAQQVITQHG